MIVYKTTNLINSKIYVGQDKYNNPKYLGSGKIFILALKKYGRINFKKEILEYCINKEDLNKKEIYWISKLNANDRNIGYNISTGGSFGDCLTFNPNREEIRKKISIANKGKIRSIEYRQLLSKSLMGHFVTEHTKQRVRETRIASKGKCAETTKEKLRKILKDRCSGENNIAAKMFYLISPTNEVFSVKGGLLKFCEDKKINVNVIRSYCNKGKIPSTSKNQNEIRNNTNGWEIKTDLSINIDTDNSSIKSFYYIVISPDKIEHVLIYESLMKFSIRNNLDYGRMTQRANMGVMPAPVYKHTIEAINTTGWEVKKIYQ